MRRSILALVLIASAARADTPIPGWKDVEHTTEVTGLPDGTRFVLAPLHLGMGSKVVDPGVRFTFNGKYTSPHLYALEEGSPPKSKEEVDRLLASDAPRTAKQFADKGQVRSLSPVERIHTVYEFVGIEGGRIELRHVSTTYHDGSGNALTEDQLAGIEASEGGWNWPPLLLSAAALVALVAIVLVRRRRAAAASAP